MNEMMGGMWSTGVVWLLIVALLMLAVAALVKYLIGGRR